MARLLLYIRSDLCPERVIEKASVTGLTGAVKRSVPERHRGPEPVTGEPTLSPPPASDGRPTGRQQPAR